MLHLLEGPTELLTNLFRHFRLSSPGLNRYEMVSQLSVRQVTDGSIDSLAIKILSSRTFLLPRSLMNEVCVCVLVQIKVLMSSEDCPERRLPVWTHYVLQVRRNREAMAQPAGEKNGWRTWGRSPRSAE